MSLLDVFLARAGEHPDRAAIMEADGRSITYGELLHQAGCLACVLDNMGIRRGERVLVAVWPGIDLYVGLAALWSLGAVAVFPEAATGLSGLRYAAATAQPVAVMCTGWMDLVRRLFAQTRAIPKSVSPRMRGSAPLRPISLDLNEPALISYTSGSTGKPKGIVRSHGLLLAQHGALSSLMSSPQARQVDLVAFPAFVLSCLGHGSTAVLPGWDLRRHDRADANAITAQIRRQRVTRAFLPPACVANLSGVMAPACLKRIFTGGGPVYPDVAATLLRASPGLDLTVLYGSTEAEPISHISLGDMSPEDWATARSGGGLPAGKPVPEARVRLVDGEVEVAGPHVVRGYMDPARDLETKRREGDVIWHRTGDAARMDDAGRLWLLGRASSVVQGVFPFAVESAARTWPGVRAAAMTARDGKPVLFIEGEKYLLDRWREQAAHLGIEAVVWVDTIPMDRRHRSKVDVASLLALDGARGNR